MASLLLTLSSSSSKEKMWIQLLQIQRLYIMQPSVTYSNQFRRMAFVSEWPCWQNSELYMSPSSSSNPQPATRTCGPRLHTHHCISASEIPVSAIGLLGLGLYASFKAIGADECMYATQIPHLGCPSLHDSEIPMHYWKKGFWQIILIARIYFSAQVVKKQKNLTLMLNTTIISKSSCGCLYVDLGLDKGNPDHQYFSQQGEHSTRETLRCSLTLLWSPCVSCQNWVISLIFRESTSSQEIRPKKNKKHRGHFSRIFIRSCCFKSLSSFSNKVIIHDYYDYLNIS